MSPDPMDLLHRYRTMMLRGEAPTRQDLLSIWRLSRHPDAGIREAALILISSPPVEDEAAYMKALLDTSLKGGPTIARHVPVTVFEELFDLWEQADAHGIGLAEAAGFRALLSRLPKPAIRTLVKRPYSLRAFLPLIAGRLARMLHGHLPSPSRRRWRRLARELCRQQPATEWSRLTFPDLPFFGRRRGPSPRSACKSGFWVGKCRPLMCREAGDTPGLTGLFPPSRGARGKGPGPAQRVAPHPTLPGELPAAAPPSVSKATPSACRSASSFREVRWAGLGNLSLSWMDALRNWQGRELAAVRALARQVSRSTRRVVFSWHNAGLAAAGGWSFEDLDALFPSTGLWREFAEAVRRREIELGSGLGSDDAGAEFSARQLLRLRGERLAVPAIRRALLEICALKEVDPAWTQACISAVNAVARLIPEASLPDDSWYGKHGWVGLRSPGQRRSLPEILAWWEDQRQSWTRGLARLAALALEGQLLLARGDLELFVLPWIEKFFMSSTRLSDSSYLPGLAQWIEDRGIQPLILFWEDTIHPREPTFKLALDAMRARGLPYRGIGLFDEEGSDRLEAIGLIRSTHTEVRLFALRPLDDTHHPGAFHRMLEARDFSFLTRYDSSWKDNLAFPYSGTQVFPLLSDAGYCETLPAWLAADGRRQSFGRFFRGALRRKTLGPSARRSEDPLSSAYACWANLR